MLVAMIAGAVVLNAGPRQLVFGSAEIVHPVPTGNVAAAWALVPCPQAAPPVVLQVATLPEIVKVPVHVVQVPPLSTLQFATMDETGSATAGRIGIAGEITDAAIGHDTDIAEGV